MNGKVLMYVIELWFECYVSSMDEYNAIGIYPSTQSRFRLFCGVKVVDQNKINRKNGDGPLCFLINLAFIRFKVKVGYHSNVFERFHIIFCT